MSEPPYKTREIERLRSRKRSRCSGCNHFEQRHTPKCVLCDCQSFTRRHNPKLSDRARARTRNHSIIIEGWFQNEQAAINFCDTHNAMSPEGYLRLEIKYYPSHTGNGFIAFRRVTDTNKSGTSTRKNGLK
jgi:hypothetical protein